MLESETTPSQREAGIASLCSSQPADWAREGHLASHGRIQKPERGIAIYILREQAARAQSDGVTV